MTLNDFLAHLRTQPLEAGVTNKVGKPVTDAAIARWEKKHPGFPLPEGYRQLLRAADGFTLQANRDSPLGILHVLPLKRVRPLAAQVMDVMGLTAEDLTDPPTCLMVGDDQDGQWCIGLDTATGHFLDVDYSVATTDLGPLPQFLDWVTEKSKG